MRLEHKRIVLDTSTLVSAALFQHSNAAMVYSFAANFCTLFASTETLAELEDVLFREKFDRYFLDGRGLRERFISNYRQIAALTQITYVAEDCIDPGDNKFLSLIVSVDADFLVTGDKKHLIPMHPYHGVAIVSERAFVELLA